MRLLTLLLLLISTAAFAAEPKRPNVLLIITDDQGYGDIGFHGNTMLKTPNLDALAKQSIRLTNFHVDPTCAETRSALMTGKYSCRVGVWHTIMGRSILRKDEKIMPQYFAEAGYATGCFGKWHLGDNWPYRPHDRGFQEALYCHGGGVGQSPDHWGNDYFDDTYMRSGVPEKQTGYCTDVWFREATKFIEKQKEKPFFCYVATNAPHAPYHVDPKYSEPYEKSGVPQPMASFYGMIANIDENIGRLLGKLDEWKLAENTIVIFMTDNGSAMGVQPPGRAGGVSPLIPGEKEKWLGFNAGMRAQKGSQYEGGHRVPCFIRFPGKLRAGTEENFLVGHMDVLPILLGGCGISCDATEMDGYNIMGSHYREPTSANRGARSPPTRTMVVHSQRVEHPQKWLKCAVMNYSHHTDGTRHEWRLIDGKELYDLRTDPGQKQDAAAKNPDVVKRLRDEYEKWWTHVSPRFGEYSDIPLGDERAPVQELCCHDWHPVDDKMPPWNQSGQDGVAKDPLVNGQWAVEIARPGRYAFTLRMRPAGVPYKVPTGKARVKIGDAEGTADITAPADSVTITLDLKPTGHVMLQTWLAEAAGGKSRGAYYTIVKRLGD